jgi:DNA processing protein
MCQGVVVIESDAAGGSMITARFAGEQGRTLMAVPGRIDQASSVGCHQLIRDGAIMVTSVDDILEELRYARPKEQELNFEEAGPKQSPANLSDSEQRLVDCFKGGEILSMDALVDQSGLPMSEVSGQVMGLELKRVLAKRADGRFEAR